ncbi:MAG: hypothetical protein B7Z66_02935 [Chromatiales bacterium 21-64-14]|nr:MAG: hypothetical protein B7Z66_02935 [Chromatiales bacterium 21-64-14]
MELETDMERRWSDRLHVALDAVLLPQDSPLERCRTRDIGLEGAFLCTRQPRFRTGTRLDVEFLVPRDGELARRCLPALVIHHAEDGLGVMFLAFDQQTFRSIEELVYGTASLRLGAGN